MSSGRGGWTTGIAVLGMKRRSELAALFLYGTLLAGVLGLLVLDVNRNLSALATFLHVPSTSLALLMGALVALVLALMALGAAHFLVHSSREAPALGSCPALKVELPERKLDRAAEALRSALSERGLRCEVVRKGALVGKLIDSYCRITVPDQHVSIHFITDWFSSGSFWLMVAPEPFPGDAGLKVDGELISIVEMAVLSGPRESI